MEIATAQVDFEPTGHQIRLIKRGLQSREIWLVGLERRDENDTLTNATSVLVDADTGEVIEVRPSGSDSPRLCRTRHLDGRNPVRLALDDVRPTP